MSELQWQCLTIEVRFQKMYGFSIVISIDSLIIRKDCKRVQTTCWTPPGTLKDVCVDLSRTLDLLV